MTRILVFMLLATSALIAQTGKPWLEWNAKETTRILNESAWGQTQLETKEAEGASTAITNTGSSRTMVPRDASKDSPGGITSYIKYYIRLLSAKPVRQALVRKLMLDSPEMKAEQKEQLKAFAEATGGTIGPSADALRTKAPEHPAVRRPITGLLLALALLSWFADILARRVRLFE